MKVIKNLVSDIREEMEGAEHYAKLATQYKDDDRQLADMYYKMSTVEVDHVNALHEQAVRLIKESKTPAPAPMQAVWDWEHEKMIDTIARIRAMLDTYKSM